MILDLIAVLEESSFTDLAEGNRKIITLLNVQTILDHLVLDRRILDHGCRIKLTPANFHSSSDFISGFCGGTEADHEDTLSLMRAVRFDKAFMFAYSMREKTHAHRRLVDDVPPAVKQARLREVRRHPSSPSFPSISLWWP